MASTARDVIMTFRGQNYLSGAIRRVGRDVGSLSRQTQLSNAARQLQINQSRLVSQKGIAEAELQSVTTGQRALALQQAKNQLSITEQNALARTRDIEADRMRTEERLLKNRNLVGQLAIAQQQGKTFVGSGVNKMLTSDAMKAAQIQQQRLLEEMATLNLRAETQQEQLTKLAIASQQLGERDAALTLRQQQLNDQIHTTNAALDLQKEKAAQLAMQIKAMPWENFQNGARTVEHLGRVMQMAGLIGTATFGYLAKSAADFNTQSVLAATQAAKGAHASVGAVRQVGAQLQNELTKMLTSGQTTAQPSELTNAAYRVFSSITFSGSQQAQLRKGIDLVKQFNQVLTANYGMVSFDEVTQAGIMIINNFDKNLKNVHGDLNTLQAAVRFGNFNMSEFIGTLNQAAPAGKAAGYNFNEVASSIAFLSRTLSPRIASAGYARLTELLTKNAAAFKQNGIEVTKAGGGLKPLNDIVSEMIQKFPKLATGQMGVIDFLEKVTGSQSTVQARRALTQYLHDLSGARQITAQVTNDTGELTRAAIASGQSPGVAWAKFTNQLRGLVLLIGSGAIPAFARLGAPIERFVKYIADLSPHTQRLIGYIGAMAAAFTLLGGTLLAVLGGFGSLLASFRMLIGFAREGRGLGGMLGFAAKDATEAKVALAGLSDEAGFVSLRMAGGLGIVALIPILIMFHRQVGTVVNDLGGLGNAIALLTVAFSAFTVLSALRNLMAVGTAVKELTVGMEAFTTANAVSNLTELGTAVKIATVETIGLRTALLSIAGLVVTAFVLVKFDKQATDAIRHGFGDTLDKQIDAVTGNPRKQSFWQKFGEWFTRPDLFKTIGNTPFINPFSTDLFNPGSSWRRAMSAAHDETERMSLAYKTFLGILGRQGSPSMLKTFEAEMKRAQLSTKSSDTDLAQWLSNLKRASFDTGGIRNLGKELDAIHKNEFELARQNPFNDVNNRVTQAAANTARLAQHLQNLDAQTAKIAKSANDQGVVATRTYQQLYRALVQAERAVHADPSLKNQRALIAAQQALQGNVSKQEAAAAQKAAAAAAQVAPAWQAATQAGIVATATYVKLYNAVNKAQMAMEKDPTIANQRAFLRAQDALNKYVDNVTQANKTIQQNTQATFQDVVQGAQQMYESLLQQNQQNFGTLFSGPFINSPAMQNYTQWGGKLTGRQLTKDLQSQVRQFREFNNLLTGLARRGAPQELINQLRAMGPAAIQQIRTLSRMSGPELRKYFNLFKQGQAEIHRATMQQLNQQLKDYLRYGRNIGRAMIAGLRQESPALTKAIERAVRNALGGTGTGGGGRGAHHRRTDHSEVHHHQHDHMHVHGNPDSKTMTKARHDQFRNRHRRRRPMPINPNR